MNSKYLEAALQQIPNPELLINIVSRRVRQLAQGHRPLTQTHPKMDHADIALKEISEGKLGYEILAEEDAWDAGNAEQPLGPRGVDMLFDCRFLKNPYWDPDLRPLDGRDPRVAAHIATHFTKIAQTGAYELWKHKKENR